MKNPLTNQRILFDCCSALFVTVGSLGRGGLDIGISKARAVRGPTKNFEGIFLRHILTTAKHTRYVRTHTSHEFSWNHGRILDHAPMAKMWRREAQTHLIS